VINIAKSHFTRGKKMKIRFSLVVVALLICSYASFEVAGQTPGNDSKQKSESTWRGKIAANGLVEISGILGDISVETTSDNEVEVLAVKEGNTREFAKVQLRVEELAGGAKVCAAFPLLDNEDKSQCVARAKFDGIHFENNRELRLSSNEGETQSFRLVNVQLQMRVRVPAGTRIVARTLRGNIEAKGISAKLQAVATNGGVTASLGARGFSDPVDLHSTNGSIRLTVPDDTNAQVFLDTLNGELATELPIIVSSGFRGNHLEGAIGRGGQRISLSTLNGDVEIRRIRSPANPVTKTIPETKRNEFAWRGRVPPDGFVEIIGISGDIDTEVSSGDEVEVIAVKEGAQDETDRVQISVEESANGVKVCAAFPILEGQGKPECLADERWKNMSLTQSGDSDRKLSLRYENGKKQSFRVGDIRVQFKVRIPARTQFNAQVRLEAWSGEIATDFPLTVLGRLPSKSLIGTIGQGGQKITLRTFFGNVELRRAR
jgi:putative adhesin